MEIKKITLQLKKYLEECIFIFIIYFILSLIILYLVFPKIETTKDYKTFCKKLKIK